MKDLVLIGAGSAGREILDGLHLCKGYNKEFRFKGFIDNRLDRLDKFGLGDKIIALTKDYIPQENDRFLCTISDNKYRKQYVILISKRNGKFMSIQHSTSIVSERSQIGDGVYIGPFSGISCDTQIGNHILFNAYCSVGHDVQIEDFCSVGAFTLLAGYSQLHTNSTVHPHCVILPKVKVGSNSTVGAGSIVIKSVKPNCTVFGSPAQRIS